MITVLNAEISIVGIVIATIANVVVGMVIFNPSVLGNMWMKELKMKVDMAKATGLDYGLSILSSFVTAVVMSLVIYYGAVASTVGATMSDGLLMGEWTKLSAGIAVGLLTWFGFAATTLLTVSIWEMKTSKLYMINLFHHLVSYVVMGVILAMSMNIFE